MSESRERTNSTHEAYLRRVSIPPIMIPPIIIPPPTPPFTPQKEPQVPLPKQKPRQGWTHGKVCGCAKIVGGYLLCPIICPLSCLGGACRTIYYTFTCNAQSDDDDPHKLCQWWGCYNACTISSTIIEEGVKDIRQTPHIEKDMVR